ncbi:uroporphyrinogen-III C-methyltransferase [Nocardioides marmoriginsengisoli]|uniref:Uroporphyrinogen-III C-methyltransferase n=1 Tax=Nocardioides marmoriginsengisoli TaxID=661483 RepID=A0A3N0CS19_9ACTN|nr:uroporphyrinogen-III C-methyltransferase [Nocardioides marmoriginsengisoli]RNL65796.1 uroporphyrinogen-III C-methyltransferase [Nocardioides marmoriginsengisoli]
MTDYPTYPSGLRLAGRKVVVVGGGQVAQRRIPSLIAAGAEVLVVSPEVTPAIEGLVGGGEVILEARAFVDSDLDGAWYVIAATADAEVNAQVLAAAEARHTFCVRSDDAQAATAWTPAVGRHGAVTVAVLGDRRGYRDSGKTAALRDRILDRLQDGSLDALPDVKVPGVVLIGGGPGDPNLITVAGRKALMEADVVVADRLAPRELLGELSPDVELVDVAKLPRGRSAQQEEINRIIVEAALAGKRVARFKGGDNFVFGRGYEEILACRDAGVPVTVIPGISSPIAVPGIAGIPVTHRGVTHEFTVISGHLPPGHPESLVAWDGVARMRGTVVLMMGVENAPVIAETLVELGRDPRTPVGIVCDGTMPTERTVLSRLGTVGADIAEHQVKAPAIIVIGDVVAVAHPDHFAGG